MSSNISSKGDAFKAEALKALSRTSVFDFLGVNKTQKYEDAAELFVKAGNAYKLAQLWESAGQVFTQAAEAFLSSGSQNDAINNLVEAGNNFKKINPEKAIETFSRCIEMYNEAGRFGMSAKLYKELAEMNENMASYAAAIECYQHAADFYENDNKKSAASECLKKVAILASDKNSEYLRAANIFESIGKESMTSKLGAYSAKGYFFQSLMCLLASSDCVAADLKMEEFKNIDYTFGGSRECDFITKLIQATKDNDGEAFSEACADFDRITPLDPWKTSMLLRAKQVIQSSDEDDVDLS